MGYWYDDKWKRFEDDKIWRLFSESPRDFDYPSLRREKPITFCGNGVEPLVDFFKREDGIEVYIFVPGVEAKLVKETDERAVRVCTNPDCRLKNGLYKGVKLSFQNVDYSSLRIKRKNGVLIIHLPYNRENVTPTDERSLS
jgi:HSP20 family molecular chaperone IbpA